MSDLGGGLGQMETRSYTFPCLKSDLLTFTDLKFIKASRLWRHLMTRPEIKKSLDLQFILKQIESFSSNFYMKVLVEMINSRFTKNSEEKFFCFRRSFEVKSSPFREIVWIWKGNKTKLLLLFFLFSLISLQKNEIKKHRWMSCRNEKQNSEMLDKWERTSSWNGDDVNGNTKFF